MPFGVAVSIVVCVFILACFTEQTKPKRRRKKRTGKSSITQKEPRKYEDVVYRRQNNTNV